MKYVEQSPRKVASVIKMNGPYLERTHVAEASSLRRASQLLLRNSAKLHRKLAIRCTQRKLGRSEEAEVTVYQKHSSMPSRKAMYMG